MTIAPRRACILVFCLSFLVRAGMLAWMKPQNSPTGSELRNIALSVAREGVFGNPYFYPTGPTAHTTPLYPLAAGTLYKWFGTEARGELAIYLLNTFFVSLQYSLIPLIALLCDLPLACGVLGGLIGALLPVSFLTEIRSMESMTSAVFIILAILTLQLWRTREFGWKIGLAHGLLWGMAALVNASLLPVAVAWSLAALLWIAPDGRRQVAAYTLCAMAAGAIVIAPWAIRNHRVFGHWVPLRSNFGLELHVSNNEDAYARFEDNVRKGGYRIYHPAMTVAQAQRVAALGEVRYNEEHQRAAIDWIRHNPGAFLRLTAERVVYFWFPSAGRSYQSPILWLISALAFHGLYLLRRHRLALIFITAVWLSFPLIYYVMQAHVRYRLPMQWSLLLLAGLSLSRLLPRSADHRFSWSAQPAVKSIAAQPLSR